MKEIVLEQLNLYVWAKDKNFKYIYCNENYAKAAGLDSPSQIEGKTDDQMPWGKLADFFRAGDYGVLQGTKRINSPEVSDTVDGVTDILVSENQLLNSSSKCIGVVGSFIDITGKQLIQKTGHYDALNNRYYLGEDDFDNVYFTGREIEVFKRLLLGYSAKQTAELLKISPKTVEDYVDCIKLKLQAKSKGEIIATAIQFGLTHILRLKTHDCVSIS
jgi:DNA-binding CsgD family transcriptional regulator